MNDEVLGKLREAKALLSEERDNGGNSRELSVTLTEIDTAILWRQSDLQIKAPANDEVATKSTEPSIREIVLEEYKKGNIIVSTFEGLKVAPLAEIIKQPIAGLLYDLNRLPEVILKFIDDPKWINDYAMMQVVKELKRQLDENGKDFKQE